MTPSRISPRIYFTSTLTLRIAGESVIAFKATEGTLEPSCRLG